MMLTINEQLNISDDYIQFRYVRSRGPGGQNVNKVNSCAQLTFNVMDCPDLPDSVKKRFIRLAGSKMTTSGECVIESDEHRTQKRNREETLERLRQLIHQALIPPKKRRPTKPTAASKRKRLEDKKRRGVIKSHRKTPKSDE